MMSRRRTGEPGRGVVLALAWAVISFLVLPIAVIFPVSLTDTRYLSLPEHGLSLQHWAHFLTSEYWLSGIWQSALIGVVSAAIATISGTLAAIALWRLKARYKSLIFGLMMLPLVVPTIVYAIGLYRYLIDLGLLNSRLGVILAHAVTGLPYVIITVTAALGNFDPRLEQAARNLGATTSQTIRWVIVPNVLPGVLSGAVFAFAHSWDELVIVLFVGGRAVLTLPRLVWEGIHDNLDPVIAVVSAAMIAFTLLLMLAEILLRRLQEMRA
jgi:putative spermidine/putrescine transport system permease protein